MMHPRSMVLGGVVAVAFALTSGLETIGDPATYHDHGWAFYVFGADAALFAIVVARAALQGRTNKAFEKKLDDAIKERLLLAERVGVLEGVAQERQHRLNLHRRMLDALRDRTVILRDCDEDHEIRLSRIEERFRIAHDQAVARVALRGRAFDDSLEEDRAVDDGSAKQT